LIVIAHGDGCFAFADRQTRCAVGRGGVISAADKREGDGATPAGLWTMRGVVYRPDRGGPPATRLPSAPMSPEDGWCDAPSDPRYNRPVKHPYPASAEYLWREDGLYDLIVPLGYNDRPVVPGKGSAIFLHCASADYRPTAGCVAVSKADLLQVLAMAEVGSAVDIRLD
jgi:L,D-peptidoglycan transpeptidase YkuD (ErfK/YbiS/YcfS/YnhG family)